MVADADASELGRALAARRWAPEARLAAAVETVVTLSSELSAEQLDDLRPGRR